MECSPFSHSIIMISVCTNNLIVPSPTSKGLQRQRYGEALASGKQMVRDDSSPMHMHVVNGIYLGDP